MGPGPISDVPISSCPLSYWNGAWPHFFESISMVLLFFLKREGLYNLNNQATIQRFPPFPSDTDHTFFGYGL